MRPLCCGSCCSCGSPAVFAHAGCGTQLALHTLCRGTSAASQRALGHQLHAQDCIAAAAGARTARRQPPLPLPRRPGRVCAGWHSSSEHLFTKGHRWYVITARHQSLWHRTAPHIKSSRCFLVGMAAGRAGVDVPLESCLMSISSPCPGASMRPIDPSDTWCFIIDHWPYHLSRVAHLSGRPTAVDHPPLVKAFNPQERAVHPAIEQEEDI